MILTAEQCRRARTKQLESLFSNAYFSIGAGFFVAIFLFWLMYGHVQTSYLTVWFAYLSVAKALNLLVVFLFPDPKKKGFKTEKWLNLFLLCTVLIAIGWAGTITFMFSSQTSVHQVYLILVLLGVTAGATASLGSLRKAFYFFILPILLPLTVRFLVDDYAANQAFGLICFVYTVFILFAASRYNQFLLESFSLSIISNDLAGHLRVEKKNVEMINRDLLSEIERRRQIENELRFSKNLAEESNISKNNFLQNITHEFRTPMNGILGMTQVLLESTLDENQRSNLLTLQSSSQRLYQLLENLLTNSEINSKDIIIHQTKFKLLEMVKDVVQRYQEPINKKKLQLREDYDDKITFIVYSDPVLLSRVLESLLDNAVKFTEKGSISITLQVTEKGDNRYQFVFKVTDTGIGIAEDQLGKIFEVLTQLDHSITRKFQGAGLGLSIAKRAVTLLGGEISVKSVLDEGTEITLSIPLLAASNEIRAKHKLYILLAEDNSLNRNLANIIFKRLGHKLKTVTNGKEAVDAAKKEKFDMIFMDLSMPVMDGLEAAKQIRAFDQNIPIIGLSGSGIKNEIKRCMQAGMNGFQTKPYHAEKLSAEIANFYFIATSPSNPHQSLTTSDSPSSDPEDLHLEGIDFNAGLRRWGNNRKVYVDALKQFAKEHSQDPKKLIQYASSKDFTKLALLAHALKGVATNISATDLAHSVEKLERTASQGDFERIEERVHSVNITLKKVFENIEGLQTDRVDDGGTRNHQMVEFTESEFEKVLEKLKICIEKGENVEAVHLTQQLIQGGKSDKLTKDFETLMEQLENFDFSDADTTLTRILSRTHRG